MTLTIRWNILDPCSCYLKRCFSIGDWFLTCCSGSIQQLIEVGTWEGYTKLLRIVWSLKVNAIFLITNYLLLWNKFMTLISLLYAQTRKIGYPFSLQDKLQWGKYVVYWLQCNNKGLRLLNALAKAFQNRAHNSLQQSHPRARKTIKSITNKYLNFCSWL